VGSAGTIIATSDGGATWIARTSGTTQYLNGVAFPDETHGFAVGNAGVILATSDGGATWSPQVSGTTAALYAVAFTDATHGWAVGYAGIILATSDGGATWLPQSSGTTQYLYAVAFPDSSHGWAVGANGAIVATTSGGFPPAPAAPSITKLLPAAGRRGALVTVSGTDFGAAQGAGSVKFGARTCTKYVSWSAAQIKCRVPTAAKYGSLKVTVTTTGGASNAMSFTVKR